MRCFEHDLRLGETPIGELRIDVRSRDDIPALLLGLAASVRVVSGGVGNVVAPACDDGSGSGERSPGDDAVAGSGDGGAEARVGLRPRPFGRAGEPSSGGSAATAARVSG